MHILIIEDEQPALKRLTKLITEVAPETQVLGTADSIESAILLFDKFPQAELAFMDIELADGQSFEIFNRTQVNCPVIFTTAYDEFALRAFKLNSVDYLLKPIEKDELKAAIQKYKTLHHNDAKMGDRLAQIIGTLPLQQYTYRSRFLIKNGNKLISVSVDEIAYFHASEKVVYVYLLNGNRYIMDQSLELLSKTLDPKKFFQVNRQFTTHFDAVKQIHTWFNGKLKLELEPETQEEVIVSREKASEFKKWMGE